MRKEILRVNQLNKMYNQDRILKNISFFVREGEIVSMIGNNGVGKTVLGKILAGEMEEDTGSVWSVSYTHLIRIWLMHSMKCRF